MEDYFLFAVSDRSGGEGSALRCPCDCTCWSHRGGDRAKGPMKASTPFCPLARISGRFPPNLGTTVGHPSQLGSKSISRMEC